MTTRFPGFPSPHRQMGSYRWQPPLICGQTRGQATPLMAGFTSRPIRGLPGPRPARPATTGLPSPCRRMASNWRQWRRHQLDRYINRWWNDLGDEPDNKQCDRVWSYYLISGWLDSAAIGVAPQDEVYTSTNSGLTWARQLIDMLSIVSSADGKWLAAGNNMRLIYTSTNSGVNWNQVGTLGNHANAGSFLAASASGSNLLASLCLPESRSFYLYKFGIHLGIK